MRARTCVISTHPARRSAAPRAIPRTGRPSRAPTVAAAFLILLEAPDALRSSDSAQDMPQNGLAYFAQVIKTSTPRATPNRARSGHRNLIPAS